MREKGLRDRLTELAGENAVDWLAGFCEECWWSSKIAQPNLHSFSEAAEPLRLVE